MLLPTFPAARELHYFPESATLALLEAALFAAEQVLRTEHPAVDEAALDPEHDLVPPLLTAHLILTRAAELRDLLALYSVAVRRSCRRPRADRDEDLF